MNPDNPAHLQASQGGFPSAAPSAFASAMARRDSGSSLVSSRLDDLGLNLDLPGLQVCTPRSTLESVQAQEWRARCFLQSSTCQSAWQHARCSDTCACNLLVHALGKNGLLDAKQSQLAIDSCCGVWLAPGVHPAKAGRAPGRARGGALGSAPEGASRLCCPLLLMMRAASACKHRTRWASEPAKST